MYTTYKIEHYTGTAENEAENAENPQCLTLPALRTVASLLAYGLHEGLVILAPVYIELILGGDDTHFLVTRDLDNRHPDNAGLIEGVACVQILRSLRWTSARVTDYARHGRASGFEEVNASLIKKMIELAKKSEADVLIFEVSNLPRDTVSTLTTIGFVRDEFGRWCLIFNDVPGVPRLMGPGVGTQPEVVSALSGGGLHS